jgi:hypothetical protein
MALPFSGLKLDRRIAAAAGAAAILAFSPVSSVSAAPSASVQAPVAVGAVDIHSILLFPISNQSGSKDNDNTGPLLDDALRLRLANVAKFRIQRFSRLLPSVQVALDSKDISSADVAGPFSTDSDKERAAKLADRVGSDAYFLGNVESVTTDATTRKVTVVVTGNLYNTQSGETIKSFGVSGNGVPESATDTAAQVLQMAVNDTASQIASSINGIPVIDDSATRPRAERKKSAAGGAAVALIAGAILFAAFHHNGNGSSGGSSTGGGGTTTPPGPPSPPGGL